MLRTLTTLSALAAQVVTFARLTASSTCTVNGHSRHRCRVVSCTVLPSIVRQRSQCVWRAPCFAHRPFPIGSASVSTEYNVSAVTLSSNASAAECSSLVRLFAFVLRVAA
eukprot:7375956-Prymnesium_polylepis.1